MAAINELVDVDFGSRVVALRAVGAALGLAPNQMPDKNMANSQRNYLHWINVARLAKGMTALPDLDYSGFVGALNKLIEQANIVLAPVNTQLPAINSSGGVAVGNVLSCNNGQWENNPTSYTHQWLRGGTAISGATAATHTIVVADEGTSLSCRVGAVNSGGTGTATSAGVAIP